jgi:DNA-binding NarL/FixJ family response regulator
MIRVLIVDDQELVRSGFRVILETEPDIEVVGEAADGAEAVRQAATLAPDVICMDVEMPLLSGIEASRRIVGEGSAASILILTTFGHEEYLFEALAAGVSGFLLKTARAEQLIDAVRALAAGQALLGPDVTRVVMERAAEHEAGRAAESDEAPDGGAASAALAEVGVTEREREVLRLVAQGRSNAEIAAELFLGEATVKTHVSSLLQKLGARDRIQLVVWAHTRGADLTP